VRWDVALDMNRVMYDLYLHANRSFEFDRDPELLNATRIALTPTTPADYVTATSTVFPYEAVIGGLQPNTAYHLCIRASDASPARNQEHNQQVHVVRTPAE
jgi:hypothetical protein